MDLPEKLMIPGPVEVSKSVLGAMGSPVRPHYGAEWTAFYNDTLVILKKSLQYTSRYIPHGWIRYCCDRCLPGICFFHG